MELKQKQEALTCMFKPNDQNFNQQLVLLELSNMLSLNLTRDQLDALVDLCEQGVNPEPLLAAMKDSVYIPPPMSNQEQDKRVKRYTDIEKPRCCLNAVRVVIIIVSIMIGAVGIFLAVYFTQKAKQKKPNSEPQVSDADYLTYIQQRKLLPAWSVSSESKINGMPSYVQLFSNESQVELLKEFILKHNYSELLLYMGCVEWNYIDWVTNKLPYQQELQKFLVKMQFLNKQSSQLQIQKYGALAYVNDVYDNFTNVDKIQYLGKALNIYNQKAPQAQQLNKIQLQVNITSPTSCIHVIEMVQLLKQQNNKFEIFVTVNENYAQILDQQLLSSYSSYESVIHIQQLNQNNQIQDWSFISLLRLFTDSVVIYMKNNNIQDISSAISRCQQLKYFNTQVVLQQKQNNPENNMDVMQQDIREIQKMDQTIAIAPESYLHLFEALYSMEPIESDKRWVADLYYKKQ